MSVNVGDKVRLSGNSKWARMGEWTVIKVNQTTYKLEKDGVILNAGKGMISTVSDGESTRTMPRPEGLRVGAIIHYATRLGDYSLETPFVVIKDNYDMLNVVPVGGDDRRRYWKVLPHKCTVVWSRRCPGRVNSEGPRRVMRSTRQGPSLLVGNE